MCSESFSLLFEISIYILFLLWVNDFLKTLRKYYRHSILTRNTKELNQHIEHCSQEYDTVRRDLHDYLRNCDHDVMVLNNEICTTKQIVERKKIQTVELQLSIDQMLKGASTNVLAYNQVSMLKLSLRIKVECVTWNCILYSETSCFDCFLTKVFGFGPTFILMISWWGVADLYSGSQLAIPYQ